MSHPNPLIKQNILDWYVRVEPVAPERHGWFHKETREEAKEYRLSVQKRNAEEMIEQIKRHVDGVFDVRVCAEFELLCADCGRDWTEGPCAPHNGGCCTADCERMEKAEAAHP